MFAGYASSNPLPPTQRHCPHAQSLRAHVREARLSARLDCRVNHFLRSVFARATSGGHMWQKSHAAPVLQDWGFQ